jgi:TolB-like protein/class 3 adenylate cyclase
VSGTGTSTDLTGKAAVGRKLIAVVYADMVGYSRLIGLDDAGTLARLKVLRANLIDPAIAEHGGKIVQTGGDSLLIVFDSIDGAVRCAVKVQQQVPTLDGDRPPDRAMRFRVGINIGDAIADGTDLHGDAVNVAARLQEKCPPGEICISRSVRDHIHGQLDLAFEDMGEQTFKNIARPLRVYRLLWDSAPVAASESLRALPILAGKPSIAVLPFANMSGDPEQEYFVDGMVEEIITSLSHIRWLFVIARNSSFIYKGQSVDIKKVGLELGVRYVVGGSVRKAGGRVRITAQLIDAFNGMQLWADHFDGSLEDVFNLQDKVADSVAGVIEPALQAAEIRRSVERPTNDLTAYDLYLRALARFFPVTRERLHEALGLLDQAIGRDPQYAPALAWAAVCQLRLHMDGWTDQPEVAMQKGLDFARRALQTAGNDPATIANGVFALAYFGENIDAMMALIDDALMLNPSFARGWFLSGHVRLMAGKPESAIEHAETSLRLSPRIRMGGLYHVIGPANFFKRNFEEAASKLLVAIQEHPGAPVAYRFLAATYAHAGRLDEARKIVEQLRAITPVILPSVIPYRSPEHRELLLSGLRLAAGEVS